MRPIKLCGLTDLWLVHSTRLLSSCAGHEGLAACGPGVEHWPPVSSSLGRPRRRRLGAEKRDNGWRQEETDEVPVQRDAATVRPVPLVTGHDVTEEPPELRAGLSLDDTEHTFNDWETHSESARERVNKLHMITPRSYILPTSVTRCVNKNSIQPTFNERGSSYYSNNDPRV